MLRGLGLRESNSVCGRAIQKPNGGNPRDANDYSHDQKLDGGYSSITSQSRPDYNTKNRPRRPRIVKVLDVAETAGGRSGKFIQFKTRLHPWTTIKVSYRSQKCFFKWNPKMMNFEIWSKNCWSVKNAFKNGRLISTRCKMIEVLTDTFWRILCVWKTLNILKRLRLICHFLKKWSFRIF